MKTSDALWFALIALGKEGGNMDGGKYRTEWLQVRDAMERAKAAENAEAAAPQLAEALREILAMTNEDTGTFRKRGGTYRGLVGIVAERALTAAGVTP